MDDYLQRVDTAYENLRKQMEDCEDTFLLELFDTMTEYVRELHEVVQDEIAFQKSLDEETNED